MAVGDRNEGAEAKIENAWYKDHLAEALLLDAYRMHA